MTPLGPGINDVKVEEWIFKSLYNKGGQVEEFFFVQYVLLYSHSRGKIAKVTTCSKLKRDTSGYSGSAACLSRYWLRSLGYAELRMPFKWKHHQSR